MRTGSIISKPVSRSSWWVNSPPLMPISRWMRQTAKLDAFAIKRDLPREHILIDAVNQRAVEGCDSK
jgi:hypothetical protein